MTFQPYDPDAEKVVHRRGYLPHWKQAGVTYFVTFRLADAIPVARIQELKAEREAWLQANGISSLEQISELPEQRQIEFRDRVQRTLENYLDAGHGERLLEAPDLAQIVESSLRHFDGERYWLGEFVVMPNHVHALLSLAEGYELTNILHSWKSYSAHRINESLARHGEVWQSESFNHIVRRAEQLIYLEDYVRRNPEKANLPPGSFRLGRGMLPSMEDESRRRDGGATLRSLKLRHFRCFETHEATFSPGLNLIVGPNARGKTSLLEGACILLRLQSPRTSRLTEVIQHERRGFVTDGYFGERHLQFYFAARRKKLALDAVEQGNAQEYLLVARVMYFSMADIEIVRGSAEARRQFLDFVLAQREGTYRRLLRDFERALRSRNSLLKAPSPRWREIEAFDQPLLAAGTEITSARRALVAELQPHVEAAHATISGGARESLRIEYVPGAGEDFATALGAARGDDARLRQTTVGPHRDDLQFLVNAHDSRFASEGQQRTLVLSLRVAAARLLEERFGAAPVYLLDDIFGELDHSRRAALLSALPAHAQKLITLTSLEWVPAGAEAHVIRLEA